MKIGMGTATRSRRGRIAAAAAAVALAATGAVAAGAGAAQASSGFSTHITPDNTAFLLLDVSGGSTSNGGGVIDWVANGGANQSWTFIPYGNNVYEIENNNSGKCLTTDNVAGDQVYQFTCVGASTQLWYTGLTPGSASDWTIQSQSSGLYLDVNGDSPWEGTVIDTWYFNGGYNQYFGAI